jgi:hypothetical protein
MPCYVFIYAHKHVPFVRFNYARKLCNILRWNSCNRTEVNLTPFSGFSIHSYSECRKVYYNSRRTPTYTELMCCANIQKVTHRYQ